MEVPVEKVVNVPVEVPVEKVVEKRIDVPVEVVKTKEVYIPVDKVVTVEKIVENRAHQKTIDVLQEQLKKQEAVVSKYEGQIKNLTGELQKSQRQVDHRELLLRKLGVTDFSLNQNMVHLPVPKTDQAQQTVKPKVAMKEENAEKEKKEKTTVKEEPKATDEAASPSSSTKKKDPPFLSKQESRTLRRRGLFFRSEEQ